MGKMMELACYHKPALVIRQLRNKAEPVPPASSANNYKSIS